MYDVAIIGGGISGLGAALAAASAGYSTVVLEQNSLCGATSANSLRIMHGGIRYLQSFDFKRMLESCRDQHYWLQSAPQFFRKLPCVMPLSRFGLKSKIPMMLGASAYMQLAHWAGVGDMPRPRMYSSREAQEYAPLLEGLMPFGIFEWHDVELLEPRQFADYMKSELEARGVVFEVGMSAYHVQVRTDQVITRLRTPRTSIELRSRVLVSALGPWCESIHIEAPAFDPYRPAAWCKAFNVVLKRALHVGGAIGIPSVTGKLFFLVPRTRTEGTHFSVIGTGYLPYTGAPEQARVEEGELEDFLREFRSALPATQVTSADVEAVEVGVLPMRQVGKRGPQLYGAPWLNVAPRLVEMLSTKYTTFRSQGQRALEQCKLWLDS